MITKFKIETDIFHAEAIDGKIKSKILSSSGIWIEAEDYPLNDIGIVAVLDLAINVNSGKLMLKGYLVNEKLKLLE